VLHRITPLRGKRVVLLADAVPEPVPWSLGDQCIPVLEEGGGEVYSPGSFTKGFDFMQRGDRK
jgi:hypothetical protein